MIVKSTHILNPPEVLAGVTAIKTLGMSKAIRRLPAAGRPVRALDVHRMVTFIYKFNAPPAQVASSTLASLLLRVVSPHRGMSHIRAGFKAGLLRRRGRRRMFRARPSKTSTSINTPDWLFIHQHHVLEEFTLGSWQWTKTAVGRYLLRNCVGVLCSETCDQFVSKRVQKAHSSVMAVGTI